MVSVERTLAVAAWRAAMPVAVQSHLVRVRMRAREVLGRFEPILAPLPRSARFDKFVVAYRAQISARLSVLSADP